MIMLSICCIILYLTTLPRNSSSPLHFGAVEQLLVQCLAVQSSRVIVSSCVNKYSNYNTTSLSSTSDVNHLTLVTKRFVIKCTRQSVVAVNQCILCSRGSPRYTTRWRNPKHGKRLPPLSICGQVQLCSEAHGFLIYPR